MNVGSPGPDEGPATYVLCQCVKFELELPGLICNGVACLAHEVGQSEGRRGDLGRWGEREREEEGREGIHNNRRRRPDH